MSIPCVLGILVFPDHYYDVHKAIEYRKQCAKVVDQNENSGLLDKKVDITINNAKYGQDQLT